jgi:geranylgeranylglycerol-phosphate geranylgeranyltransferase
MKTILTTIKATFLLSRPVNVLIAMLSVFIAAFITGTIQPLSNVIFVCISCGLIFAAANTINDYFDLDIDKINKPYRVMPTELIAKKTSFLIAVSEYIAGLFLSLLISIEMFLFALFFAALSAIYSAYLKRTVLLGNFTVSLSTAAVFIYGGLAVRRPMLTIIPAIFAFFYHFGREIIKDIQDMKGDAENAANTFPVKFGITPSIRLIWINFLLLVLLTILPYWKHWYGLSYFLIVILGMYPVILYVLISISKNTEPKHLGFLSNLLKADMFIGLLAIYFG